MHSPTYDRDLIKNMMIK